MPVYAMMVTILRKRCSDNSRELVLAICIGQASAVAAQSTSFNPEISIARVYDSNVFFSASGDDAVAGRAGVEDDLLTRVSPALEVSRQTPILEWRGRYGFDAEEFVDHEQLSATMNRQSAELFMRYTPNPVLDLSMDVNFTETNTPGEFNTVTGLEPGRVNATRSQLHPLATYRFSPVMLGTLEYTLTRNNLDERVEGDTHITRLALSHDLGARDTLTYGYNYRRYRFEPDGEDYSHTPLIGWHRQMGVQSSLTLEAGPRISRDSTDPYFSATLTREFDNGLVDISYQRDETALVGENERIETETLGATLTRRFGPDLEMNISPAYGKIARMNSNGVVRRVDMNLNYAFNDAFNFVMSYQYYDFEDQGFGIEAQRQISRKVILMGVQFRYPGGRQ